MSPPSSPVGALAGAVRELAALVGDEVAVVRDDAALERLLRERRLPAGYVEFLRGHSSHAFVDAGLVCGGVPVWLTPVDTVEEIAACYAGQLPGTWQVCAVEPDGCYAIDASRPGGECPVWHVDEAGARRAVAPGFVEFVAKIARDTANLRGRTDRSERTAPPVAAGGPSPRELGPLARAAIAFAAVLVIAWALEALR